MGVRERIRQRRFESPAQEAVVSLLVAAGHVEQRLGEVLEPYGITHEQYNVLRILRGAGEGGLPRCDIAARLVNRAPDVTRLLDRLERRRLIERVRGVEDRRQSLSRLTPEGHAILAETDPAIAAVARTLTAPLGPGGREELARLLDALVP